MRPMSATRSAQLRLRVAALLPELVDRVLYVHEQRVDQRGQRVIIRTRPGAAVPLGKPNIICVPRETSSAPAAAVQPLPPADGRGQGLVYGKVVASVG